MLLDWIHLVYSYSGCHVQNTARCHTFATLWHVFLSFRDLLFSVFNLTWSFSDCESETQRSNSDSRYRLSQLAGDAVEVEANLSGDLWRCSKCCCTRWPMASHFSALGWDAKLTGWGKSRQEGKMQEDKEDGQKFELSASFRSISIISRWRCVCLHSHPLVTEMKRRWRVAWILLQCFPHVLQEEPIPRMILEISLHENPSSAFIKLWDFTKVLAPSFDCIRNML